MPYHILMYSRPYGTQTFPVETLDQAVAKLAELARQAEEECQKDRAQRYFCLIEEGAAIETETPVESLVIFLEGGCLRWIAGNRADLRVFILDADCGDVPTACFEQTLRPLADIDEPLKAMLRAHGADGDMERNEEARP